MEKDKEIDILLIQRYLAGQLDPGQMHQLERQALDDPFLADALEGYAHTKKPVEHQLSILQRQLENRIALQQEKKNYFNFSWQRLSIAAAAGLMFITVGILFWMKTPQPPQLAEKARKVDVELTPPKTKPEIKIAQNTAIPVPSEKKTGSTAAKRAPEPVRSDLQIAALTPKETDAVVSRPVEDRIAIMAAPASPAEARSAALVASSNFQAKIADRILTGGVVTEPGGKPLPGVSVHVKGGSFATSTNENGQFILPDTLNGTIALASLGYQTRELTINPGDKVSVTLNQAQNDLNEVVVVSAMGVSRSNRRAARAEANIQPLGGWQKLEEYISANKRYPVMAEKISGDVELAFTVDKNGRPQNVHITKSLNMLCDNEALRLINAGPNWNARGSAPAQEVKVTINFKP